MPAPRDITAEGSGGGVGEANARLANSEEALIGGDCRAASLPRGIKGDPFQLAQAEKLESMVDGGRDRARVKNPLQIILLAARSLSMILPADNEEVGVPLAEIRSAVGRTGCDRPGIAGVSAHRQLAFSGPRISMPCLNSPRLDPV